MKARSFQDHFSPMAAAYAATRPTYPESLFDYLARVSPGRRLAWDCATGSGQAALPLAGRFDTVVATDASAGQIAMAPRHPRVTYRHEAAERSALEDGSVDLVTVAQALHWLDLDSFYAEARRVLRPGGILAVWAYGTASLDDARLTEILHRFHYGVLGPHWPPGRQATQDGYRSLRFPFPEMAPPALEMESDWRLDRVLGYIRTWSAVRHLLETAGPGDLARFEAGMADAWGNPARPRRIRWPLRIRVGVR